MDIEKLAKELGQSEQTIKDAVNFGQSEEEIREQYSPSAKALPGEKAPETEPNLVKASEEITKPDLDIGIEEGKSTEELGGLTISEVEEAINQAETKAKLLNAVQSKALENALAVLRQKSFHQRQFDFDKELKNAVNYIKSLDLDNEDKKKVTAPLERYQPDIDNLF